MVQKSIMRIKEQVHHAPTMTQKAVRAVIEHDDKLLMIYSNNMGDYKFPGNGFEFGETESEALKREVFEESRFRIKEIKNRIATIIEVQQDKENIKNLFEMRLTYYSCDIQQTSNDLLVPERIDP